MTIDQIAARLTEIRNLGFVPTMRTGNTGIDYTLETLFGIAENNIRTPDFGEIELKSQRKNVTTPITLFTFNRGAWQVKQNEAIKTFGYLDNDGRQALYCFVMSKPNNQGLFTVTNETALQLYHTSGLLIASWSIEMILQRFAEKMDALVVVSAETRLDENLREEFWFNEAYFMSTPSHDSFVTLLRQDSIIFDVRMHLKASGAARNRGTGICTRENRLLIKNRAISIN